MKMLTASRASITLTVAIPRPAKRGRVLYVSKNCPRKIPSHILRPKSRTEVSARPSAAKITMVTILLLEETVKLSLPDKK